MYFDPYEELDYYAAWEWRPISESPGGCQDVEVLHEDGTIAIMCMCDMDTSKDSQFVSFRYV